MGTDLTVVNAARVSFDKYHEDLTYRDEKLIAYLVKHGHWTPFGHPQLQFRVSAPIFVARQLVKHQVGLVWNEVSRRYVDTVPVFHIPTQWRGKAEDKKQGSSKEFVDLNFKLTDGVIDLHTNALALYRQLLDAKVAPEQARLVLPQSMYTEWYWTGSLYAFARVCNSRISDDAQEETRYIAQEISTLIDTKFPISWKYLRKRK
tara:strand:- start:6757 stop:7368 length:612 start_codon:yes stop_codon:yes gene_type:complete